MVDFKKLIANERAKKGELPKEDIRTVRGIRTDCRTGEQSAVDVEYVIRTHEDGRHSLRVLNGPTGYESFCIEDSQLLRHITERKGWLACAGTQPIGLYAGWDKLFIPYLQMQKILDHINELGIKI